MFIGNKQCLGRINSLKLAGDILLCVGSIISVVYKISFHVHLSLGDQQIFWLLSISLSTWLMQKELV